MSDEPAPVRLFRRPGALGAVLIGLLGLNVALAWVALQATLLFPQVVWHALAGQFLPGSGVADYGRQFGWLRLAQTAAWPATAGVFLAWVHGRYGNLPALGVAGLRGSPASAVAAFLVPGPNLAAGPRVVAELSRAGAPGRGSARPTPPLVAWWWGTLLAAGLVDLLSMRPFAARAAPGAGGGMAVLVVAEALRIGAGVLAVAVVLRVHRTQSERAERLAGPALGGQSRGREGG